jgi:TolB-like protein/DNA-binding winged helix-turn-helix (wHTH) protein
MDLPGPDSYRFGPFEVNLRAAELRKGGARVRLQQQPFRVLAALVRRPGQLVTREELQQELWPEGAEVDLEHGLNNAVNRLREALGDDADTPRFVERLARRGYRFLAPLEPLPGPPAPSGLPEEAAPPAGEELAPRRLSPGAISMGAAVLALAALTAASFLRGRPAAPEAIKSIAVLPLHNLSADPDNEYFSDGLTESLITALSRAGALRVVSRGAVFQFKGRHVDPREAGRALGVEAVLEGSVRRGAGSMRVVVRLVSVRDGLVLWSRASHEEALGDVFALQDEIALSTVAALRLQLGQDGTRRVAKRHTESVEAYEAYLKGRYLWNQRTAEALREAVECFEQALRLDPRYALAHVGLAETYVVMEGLGLLSSAEAGARVKAAANRALEIDDELAEAYVSLAWLDWWDWANAERDFARALALNPNHATARQWHAEYLTALGRFDEAVAEIRLAQLLDPKSPVIGSIAAQTFFYARRYDRAAEESRKVLALHPDFALAHAYLALACAEMGKHEEAAAAADRAVQLERTPATSYLQASVDAASGRRARAQRRLDALVAAHGGPAAPAYRVARIYARLGQTAAAFEWFEKAFARRDQGLVWLKVDPSLDELRSDPRFVGLLRRAGLIGDTAGP